MKILIALFLYGIGMATLTWLYLRHSSRKRYKALQDRNAELREAIETLNHQLRDHDAGTQLYINLCHEHYELALQCTLLNAENSRLRILAGQSDGAATRPASSKKPGLLN